MTTVIGAAELRVKLDRMDGEIARAVREVVRESADSLVDEIGADAPWRTGVLSEAIEADYDSDGLGARVGVARGSDRERIAEYLEYGTSSITARPFATPQAEIERGLLPARVTAHVRAVVE